MTIREFSRLCGCNPQTLRYYDHIELLKPVRVDQWSGYRFYEEEQALAFVKIKNLQRAGFSIEEIKKLLDKDNRVICEAFDAKIAEEARLREIKAIRSAYQTEMTDMKKKLEAVRDMVKDSLVAYDPSEEFGLDKETYSHMTENVNDFFEGMLLRGNYEDYEYSEYSGDAGASETPEYAKLLNDPAYETVYEKHGWSCVREFFSEFSSLEEGCDHAMVFALAADKQNHVGFINTAIGMLLSCNPPDPSRKRSLSCSVSDSRDGQNHFWLLKKTGAARA